MSKSGIQKLSSKYAIDISSEKIDEFFGSLPLKLSNNEGFAKGWDAAWSIPDLNLVNDCLLTVACESLCSNGNSLFLTEKTLKPILFLSPFVVAGDPFTLLELERLGFKTFSPFIDESYDTIIDSKLRIQEIMRQIKNLATSILRKELILQKSVR